MSLCLHALKALEPNRYCEMKEIFDQFSVPYETMCNSPKEIIRDPNLVVQIERNFYTWENGAPMIMSYLAYKKPLPPDQNGLSLNEQMLPNAKQLEEQSRIDEMFEMYENEFIDDEGDDDNDDGGPGAKVYLNQDSEQRQIAFQEETKNPKSGDGDDFEEIEEEPTLVTIKTLTPSSEQLKSLNLQPGENEITFSVKSRLQGDQFVTGKIFMWDYRTKIVISDVDGTITRSDVMGHVMPRFGHDWSHQGICNLFQRI